MWASRPTLIGLLMRGVGSPTPTLYFIYVSATLSTVKGLFFTAPSLFYSVFFGIFQNDISEMLVSEIVFDIGQINI